MKSLSTEKSMTVREVADILGLDPRTIQLKVKELFPHLVRERKTTFLTESQVTMVKLSCEKRFAVKTTLEKELIIQQALFFQEEKIQTLLKENRNLRIKADVADRIADTDGLVLPSDAGKQITGHPIKFINWMESEGILFRRKKDGPLLPKAVLQGRGYFEVKSREFAGDLYEQTYLTGKGLAWICAKYQKAHGFLNFPIEGATPA